jgi:serine phosphatase RsbU (regulator of sigma subunit)/Tfp pilus assembly protein PilF
MLICISAIAYSQDKKADSLLTVIKTTQWDTTRIDAYITLAEHVSDQNPDTAAYYDMLAKGLAEKLNDSLRIDRACRELGWEYYLLGNYPQALNNFFTALKISEKKGNKKGTAASLGNIATIMRKQENFPAALEYYSKALKIVTELDSKNGIGNMLSNMGAVYDDIGNQALEKGDTATARKNYRMGLDHYNRALAIFESIDQKKKQAIVMGNIAGVYNSLNDPRTWDYYAKALKMREEFGSKNLVAVTLGNMGEYLTQKKKFKEAENYLDRAMKISTETAYADEIMKLHSKYNALYEASNEPTKALWHYKRFITMRDSILNKENTRKMLQTQLNYEYDKKESAIKAENEKKSAIAAAENKKQRLITLMVMIGLLLVLILAGFIFRSLRITKKQNSLIELQKREVLHQKEIIEEKNKNITDSISYARRIQQAKLPEIKNILTAFPQSFILFKPKDIVSGDFYFFHQNNSTNYIAAADCTGHGVPGAFMSLIGSEQLNDAVSQKRNTSEILSHLNRGMKTSLKQTESDSSTRDGMDIALCAIDNGKNILHYAGANRPLWIIRKDQSELEEIKATKKAIGGLTEDEQYFESHEFQLQPGDTFYICTDGFADQFGRGDKKLTTKKFKQILLDIQHTSMQEQHKHLDNFIEEWKGDNEQIDDVLVIGVRL